MNGFPTTSPSGVMTRLALLALLLPIASGPVRSQSPAAAASSPASLASPPPAAAVAARTPASGPRTLPALRMTFERNKGWIHALYNRALRDRPGIAGKLVLRLRIASSGEVLDVAVESSTLGAPDLEQKLLDRVKRFDFGPVDTPETIITYPLDFLPG